MKLNVFHQIASYNAATQALQVKIYVYLRLKAYDKHNTLSSQK